MREGLYAADVLTLDFGELGSAVGSNDEQLEADVIDALTEEIDDLELDDGDEVIAKLTAGLGSIIAGAPALDESCRWGYYYLARYLAEQSGSASIESIDPALGGSACYLPEHDDAWRAAGIELPMSLAGAACRGVPQVGRLEGVRCDPDAGYPADLFPALGYLTDDECRACLDALTSIGRVPSGLSPLLPFFATVADLGHGAIICVADWFPHASP